MAKIPWNKQIQPRTLYSFALRDEDSAILTEADALAGTLDEELRAQRFILAKAMQQFVENDPFKEKLPIAETATENRLQSVLAGGELQDDDNSDYDYDAQGVGKRNALRRETRRAMDVLAVVDRATRTIMAIEKQRSELQAYIIDDDIVSKSMADRAENILQLAARGMITVEKARVWLEALGMVIAIHDASDVGERLISLERQLKFLEVEQEGKVPVVTN